RFPLETESSARSPFAFPLKEFPEMKDLIHSTTAAPTIPLADDLKSDLVKALTHSEKNFKELVNLLPICLMIQRAEMIIYANPGLLQLLGYEKEEELLGLSPLTLIFPESKEEIKYRIKRIFAEGELYNPVIELKIKKKNGEGIYVEGESVSVVYQGLPGAMIILRDIHERKMAEESQRNAEANFRAIIQQI